MANQINLSKLDKFNEYFFIDYFLCARDFLGEHDRSVNKQQKACPHEIYCQVEIHILCEDLSSLC